MKILITIFFAVVCSSCNLLDKLLDMSYEDNIKFFEQYTGISTNYTVLSYKSIAHQVVISARLTKVGADSVLKKNKFLRFSDFQEEMKERTKSVHISFSEYELDKEQQGCLYAFNDQIGSFYSYYALVFDKRNDKLIYCLNYE